MSCERGYRQLFTGLSFDIFAGDVVQIAGPNGSGKSTLLKCLSGLSTDFSGEFLWMGESIRRDRESFHHDSCYLGHAKAVKTNLTPRENLQWFASLYPCNEHTSIAAALEKVELGLFADTLCGQLSAGQQQRVGLARLLISNAKLWILDEPFTAIDKTGVKAFENMIGEFASAGGAVIITTHHQLVLPVELRTIDLGLGVGSGTQVAEDQG